MKERLVSRALKVLACVGFMALMTGCSHFRFPAAFKIDVAQGNIIEPEKAKQLQPGMTRRQVVYLLGSPVMRNVLEEDTWYYAYQFSEGGQPAKRYHFVLQFDDDVLQEIRGDQSKIKEWHKQAPQI